MSVGVLEDVVSKLGLRSVAYTLYSIVSEPGVKYLIVGDSEKAMSLERFLDYCVREAFEDPKYGLETLEKPYIIWSFEEYRSKWETLDGQLVVFVEEDMGLKVSAIDALVSIIDKSLKKPFPPPEDWFKNIFLSTLLMVVRVVDAVGDRSVSRSELSDIIGKVIYEEQIDIVVDLLKMRGVSITS